MDYGRSPQERIENFDKLHGGDEAISDGTWVYFPDGAVREVNTMGALCEPPENPRERHKKIVYYHTILAKRALLTFDDFKSKLKENPGGWTHAESNLAELKEHADFARDCQKELEAAKAELEKYLPGYVSPELREQRAREEAATAEAKSSYLSALDAIQI